MRSTVLQTLAVLVCGSWMGRADAQDAITAILSGPDQATWQEEIALRLEVHAAPGVALGAVDASISWDPAQYGFVALDGGDFGSSTTNTASASSGTVTVNAFDAGGDTGELLIAVLQLTVLADAGEDLPVQLEVTEVTEAQTFADLLPRVQVSPFVLASPGGAADEPQAEKVSIGFTGPTEAEQGDCVEVRLAVDVAAAFSLGAVDLTIVWNPDVLELTAAEEGEFGMVTLNACSSAEGRLSLNAFDTSGQVGTATLAILAYEAVGAAPSATELSVTVAEATAAGTFHDLLPMVDPVSHSFAVVASDIASACSADFSADGMVDFSDFFLFADAFGGTDARFDLDGNGLVDFGDFFMFADQFGKPAGGGTPPESP